ncbi:unnamed protein product [Lymnaea stagnalis]|uniref:Integrin beta n=1 Tax=Lymnaea stagnalis TaxID=6523 RepID=A0AAV2IJD7_LYMST
MGVATLVAALFILLGLQGVSSQTVCSGNTCSECIAFDYGCAWCTQKNFTKPRCRPSSSLETAGCQPNEIINPNTGTVNTQNDPVGDTSGSNPNAIQIQPQKVKIRSRMRANNIITMTFRAANNFPVDLYFLFDNSISMDKQIKNLASLSLLIGGSIGNISRNYLMGYGVFQDKVILPFTDTTPVKLLNPCAHATRNTSCAPPFEYKNLLKMTKDTKVFQETVIKTAVTGNLDHPEGSADAIMQAVTCQKEIGWRNNSRKLLIFASNDRFHLAGDGRLAGIVIPNDGACHLDQDGKYAKELEQDYPSVSQLTDTVGKHEVHIIFAVTKEQEDLFKELAKRIPQSVVKLLDDGEKSNIKDIIERKYKEMISEVKIIHEKVKGVDIEIRARSQICEIQGTNVCKGLEIGSSINFDVEITVTECPPPGERKKKVVIYPEFMKNDKMELEIDIICDCQCDDTSAVGELNSEFCSDGNGTFKCGLCECYENRFGEFCECDLKGRDSATSLCSRPGDNTTKECSGFGKCECNICKCDPDYSGQFCQCYDKGCGSSNREVCGGGNRGQCVCGECKCKDGYSGSTCECSTSNSSCLQIPDGDVCSKKGVCECGLCVCDKGYTGSFCENCFLCGEGVCDSPTYRKCADCTINNQDVQCPTDCPEIQIVESLKDLDGNGICSIKQSDGCFISFRVVSSESNVTILLQKTKTCPEPVDILPIAAGVVGGVVAIGLLILLLWKILTSIFDKIEYSKFEEDLKQCKWAQQDNPFYKGATTTYKNPMLDTNQPMD